jgi:hypothetical protein
MTRHDEGDSAWRDTSVRVGLLIVAVLGFVMTLAGAAWVVFGGLVVTEASPVHGEASAGAGQAATHRLGARPADTALRPFSWRAEGWDGDLEDAPRAYDFLMEDVGSRVSLAPWVYGFADDGDFGEQVVECRRKYQRRVGDFCKPFLRVAAQQVQLEGGGTASRVVAVEGVVDESMGPLCFEFIACVGNAWRERPGPALGVPAGEVVKLTFRDPFPYLKHEALRDLTYQACVDELTKEVADMHDYFDMLTTEGKEHELFLDNYVVELARRTAQLEDCRVAAKLLGGGVVE